MMQVKHEQKKRSISGRLIICVLIIAASVGGFIGLKSLKKPPTKAILQERLIQVQTIPVERKNISVILEGYGELSSLRTLDIASEVSGKIIEIHPRLDNGEVIEKGELLFAVEDTDYRTDYEFNRERLAILKKDLALARNEFSRVENLFNNNKVGTASGVETAEKTLNSAADRLAQVRQAMTRAKINLERCRVVAPFTCRITADMIEAGNYVSPGKTLLSIADDSKLEVEVPVYGKDAVNWLRFSDRNSVSGNWYGGVEPVICLVRWTEAPDQIYEGYLHRISAYSAQTRSLKVVIRISDQSAQHKLEKTPLVAGMFVSTEIPGRTMQGVIEIPRSAVSFENTVYVVRDQRLYTQPVELIRVQGDYAYIRAAIDDGTPLIITRLVSPLEGAKVEIIKPKDGESS
jgi:multidrug efflux system membrane fusion protein